jgi:uncharacterized protein with LGFP repeats
VEPGYDAAAEGHWPHDDIDFGSEYFPPGEPHPAEHSAPDAGSAPRVSWPRGAGATAGLAEHVPDGGYGSDVLSRSDEGFELEEEDTDAVDTTPTPIVSPADLAEAVAPEPVVPETGVTEAFVVPEAYVPETYAPEADVPEAAIPETPIPDATFPDTFFPSAAAPDAAASDTAVTEGAGAPPQARLGRHAAADSAAYDVEEVFEETYEAPPEAAPAVASAAGPVVRPTIHLPLDHDPYQAPDGYPIKASARFGLYYTPSSALYYDTLAEIWFASEEAAQANGFVKAD